MNHKCFYKVAQIARPKVPECSSLPTHSIEYFCNTSKNALLYAFAFFLHELHDPNRAAIFAIFSDILIIMLRSFRAL